MTDPGGSREPEVQFAGSREPEVQIAGSPVPSIHAAGAPEPRIRVLLADDHAVLRAGLRALLEREADLEVVGEAGDGLAAVDLAGRLLPDVIVLDISMPELDGLAAAPRIRAASPGTRLLFLTMHEDPRYLGPALKSGAAGYVAKRAADTELIGAIRAVYRGETFLHASLVGSLVQTYVAQDQGGGQVQDQPEPRPASLSDRETEVLRSLAEGLAYKAIADRLGISAKTVETYRERIKEKLGASSRAELVRYALKHGLLQPGG